MTIHLGFVLQKHFVWNPSCGGSFTYAACDKSFLLNSERIFARCMCLKTVLCIRKSIHVHEYRCIHALHSPHFKLERMNIYQCKNLFYSVITLLFRATWFNLPDILANWEYIRSWQLLSHFMSAIYFTKMIRWFSFLSFVQPFKNLVLLATFSNTCKR